MTASTGTSTSSPRAARVRGRRQVGQRADRAPRAVHGVVLQRVGEREESEQERPLGPLAEHGRADGGQQHEQIDVERERTAPHAGTV